MFVFSFIEIYTFRKNILGCLWRDTKDAFNHLILMSANSFGVLRKIYVDISLNAIILKGCYEFPSSVVRYGITRTILVSVMTKTLLISPLPVF